MRLSAGCVKSLFLVVLLTSCSSVDEHSASFLQFGTIVSVRAYGTSADNFAAAVADIESLYETLNTDWYPWSDGELARINAAIQTSQRIEVSAPLAALIQSAARYETLSGGRFNAGLGRVTELWGFHDLPANAAAKPDERRISAIMASAPGAGGLGWQGSQSSTLIPASAQTMLDLGGIAKGALLLEAASVLRRHGIDNAIINLGGDLMVTGEVRGRDARIGIRSPDRDAVIAGLTVLPGESVLTSGSYERFVDIDGTRFPHILDGRDGQPVRHTASVTVIDTDPVRADAAATALLVGGAEDFDALVQAFELDYALLIDAGGDTRLTSKMRQRLHWTEAAERQ